MALRQLPPGGLPRLTFEARRQPGPAPLRTDIALFVGAATRGPVGTPVRIDGMPAYSEVFGGLSPDSVMGHAVHAYFENGGRLAWVVRIAPSTQPAQANWPVEDAGYVPAALPLDAFDITAASPGRWGDGLSVLPTYRRSDEGTEILDLDITLDGALTERLTGLNPSTLIETVNSRSNMIRIAHAPGAMPPAPFVAGSPRRRTWAPVMLGGGSDGVLPVQADYEALMPMMMELVEPALLVFPDLHQHLDQNAAAAVILSAARLADRQLDRMVVADAPETLETAGDARDWIARLGNDPAVHRTVSTYHPWIDMSDPIGTLNSPLRRMPPSGHVAGAISRMDRDVGAYITPAITALNEAGELSRRPKPLDVDALSTLGLNALRCQSARGIVIWGGRMLRSDDAAPQFVAHRRLIHRLVRGLRQVWAPRVFDPNDITLRMAVARSAITLLMEAFHANVLKGTRPEEAFVVNVDETLNTPAVIAAGRLICEIAIAPAIPMEFIHFRIGMNPDGNVEMITP